MPSILTSLSSHSKTEEELGRTDEINNTLMTSAPHEIANALGQLPAAEISTILRRRLPDHAGRIYAHLSADIKRSLCEYLDEKYPAQWTQNAQYPESSVGRLMDPVFGVYRENDTVSETVKLLQQEVQRELITYLYVVDEQQQLRGFIVMRDLLFAQPAQTLGEVMLTDVFALNPSMNVISAMRKVATRHYPVYPVTDTHQRLCGLVRGSKLFQAQAFEISAQAGVMVGVEKGERSSTHFLRSLRYRHPWLQLNLFTAFLAGAVVNMFQGTIDQIVILASFLPILAGQSGNTGCQSLAVTLRGLTLGEFDKSQFSKILVKEASLGMLNGALVGLTAALGMLLLAYSQQLANAELLALIVFIAMTGSCCISGLSGAIVPIALKRLGADPATASSIFLTTTTDVASMGLLLTLATAILL